MKVVWDRSKSKGADTVTSGVVVGVVWLGGEGSGFDGTSCGCGVGAFVSAELVSAAGTGVVGFRREAIAFSRASFSCSRRSCLVGLRTGGATASGKEGSDETSICGVASSGGMYDWEGGSAVATMSGLGGRKWIGDVGGKTVCDSVDGIIDGV